MRKLRLLGLLAPVFLLPLACEDPAGSSSGGAFTPEAGAFETGTSPEAGPAPDAAVPDAPPPAPVGITVTVTEKALPLASVRVILHDAAGAVIGEKTTDATGKVTVATAPSMVTVLIAHGTGVGSSVSPVTFMGVADGDKLVVDSTLPPANDPPAGTYSVTFTSNASNSDATRFDVVAGSHCGGFVGAASDTLGLPLFEGCLGAKNAVLSTASNGAVGVMAYGFAKDVAKPATAASTVAVGPLPFAAPGNTTLRATSLPGATLTIDAFLAAVANGALFQMSSPTGLVGDAGGTTWRTPTGFAEAYQTILSVDELNATSVSNRTFVRREAVPANGILTPVDFSTALGRITDAVLTAPTPARPEVALTLAASLATSDGGVGTFRWSNGLTETSGSWTVVFPPSTKSIKLPALPADATTFVPQPNVSFDEVIFLDATQVPSYKELKLLPAIPELGFDSAGTSKPLPVPGTVRVSRWTPGVPG